MAIRPGGTPCTGPGGDSLNLVYPDWTLAVSVYSGAQGKGAQRRHRDDRYRAAVGRQLLSHDRGYYLAQNIFSERKEWQTNPAPVEEFLRTGDDLCGTDFRSWARP